MLLSKEFKFDSAHHLPNYHGKCEKLHGHTYKLRVTIGGEPDSEGMIKDFAEVKKIVQEKVLKELDHKNLNEVIDNPSAENIAVWIWKELKSELSLFEIQVWETEDSSVIVQRKDIEDNKEF